MCDEQYRAWLESLTVQTRAITAQYNRPEPAYADAVQLGWFAVEVEDGEYPVLHSFSSFQALAAYLSQLVGKSGIRVFCFWGTPVRTTKGKFKFLVHPDGSRIPLFHIPGESEMELDEIGEFTDEQDAPLDEEAPHLTIGNTTFQQASDNAQVPDVRYDLPDDAYATYDVTFGSGEDGEEAGYADSYDEELE